MGPLIAPHGISATEEDTDTAFREGDAGLSAWVKIDRSEDEDSQVEIDIAVILEKLTTAPEESGVRGAGTIVDWGLNFGIVELPMTAAEIGSAPVETVTVYFDDAGWIVAYLSKDKPAVSLWRHQLVDDETTDDPKANERLETNLLVIAINEVVLANDSESSEMNHSDVNYFDWRYPECDAFVLFTGVADGGESDPISFVIPRTIKAIRSSAAVVIAEQTDGGGTASAGIAVDGATAAEASAAAPLAAATFTLNRDPESTSLHRVVVRSAADNSAAGAIMLLYQRP